METSRQRKKFKQRQMDKMQYKLEQMGAAFARECKIDPEHVVLMSHKQPDGSVALWYEVTPADFIRNPRTRETVSLIELIDAASTVYRREHTKEELDQVFDYMENFIKQLKGQTDDNT